MEIKGHIPIMPMRCELAGDKFEHQQYMATVLQALRAHSPMFLPFCDDKNQSYQAQLHRRVECELTELNIMYPGGAHNLLNNNDGTEMRLSE